MRKRLTENSMLLAALMLLFPCIVIGAEPATAPTTARASAYVAELGKEEFKTATAPETAPVFRWDFSKSASHNYAFSQQVQVEIDLGMTRRVVPDKARQSLTADGLLTVRTAGAGTGEMLLTKVKAVANISANGVNQSVPQEMPPLVVQGINEDGTGNFGGTSQEMMLRLLFPLPGKSLAIGESVELPMQMPFAVGASALQVTGRCRVRLVRFVMVGDRLCAELKTETDVSELKVPPEMPGEYRASFKAHSVLYFDTNRRVFQSATIAATMEMLINAPAQAANPGAVNQRPVPEMRSSAFSDNLIRVKLAE